MKKKIIVVAGPTASGKTGFGIALAKALDGEIISADSMQIYKNMPIAAAAPTADEKAQAVHHLVEFVDIDENFSVALWCELARQKIDEITSKGKIPIIVGGTGLFIDSLVDNIIFEETKTDFTLREELMKRDVDSLYDELLRVDNSAAQDIHKNNKKRVVRALELYYSGTSKTQQNINSRKNESPYDVLYFVLSYKDRQVLYDRINLRVDKMVQLGLEQEARAVLRNSTGTSAQAIGHKELLPYINGECTLEDALNNLKQKTRNYAKRQITWFKRRKNSITLELDTMGLEKAVNTAINYCEDFMNE
ncbi:MAG: tRNA (adenosine(37)-N6)-dimethylallyltransferase MiaA [Eubacterium sp.]|nr:tRNA (adenosine(37)-N6)-dimethylallyltransferase MiaA [Eubacterium sp.]MDE6156457.1 tRNA (adenosine(37)-N6)-dimethylallyltransferase MiaA [Eubacterium sp.]MDE6767889.1 tRNA (adenosine(37)-N6)-dimethylallyltransferase MiaA [Eubacterium sp.]